MDVKYGRFPRTLAVVSGVIAVYLALVALISGLFGFVASAIILLLWGAFLKLIVFAYQPEYFKVLREPKKERVLLKDGPDSSGIVEAVTAPLKEGPDRILRSANRNPVAQSRVVGKVHQEADPEVGEREEDRAWAEMFRAL